MSNEVLYQVDDKIATITVNRLEKYNALNLSVKKKLLSMVKRAEKDSSIRVIVITGAGEKAFISGGDINDFVGRDSKSIRTVVESSRDISAYITSMTKPVIAAVNGFALGAGCEIALACDVRYASNNARFGFPEINIGTLPGNGGTVRLPRLVGLGIAKELIMTGDLITAENAFRIGLVNKVFDSLDELRKGTLEFAKKLCQMPGVALAFVKQSILKAWELSITEHLVFELEAFCQTFDTEDKKEGVAAFLEKRTPEFKHR